MQPHQSVQPKFSSLPSIACNSAVGLLAILALTLIIALLPTATHAQANCDSPYVVQRGDNLTRIARNCGVAYRDLRAANPQIENPSRIEVGDRITMPGAALAPVTMAERLANATYSLVTFPTTLALRNGIVQGPTDRGDLTVALSGPTAEGDIDGDGVTDAATVLREEIEQTTGRFYSLHVMLGNRQGTVTEAGAALLGDRIGVESVQIQADGDIVVAMTAEGPHDPMAGASLNVVQTYRLEGNLLNVVAAKPVESSGTGVVCPNSYPTRLQQGDRAYVLPEPPLANTVRNAPRRNGTRIGRIPVREMMTILDGPQCADGWIWWYVDAESGVTGWVAEGDWENYWLQPGAAIEIAPQPITPVVSAITFCTRVNSTGRCLNPTSTFPANLSRIEVNWRFVELPINTRIHHRWYRNDVLVHQRDNVIWDENVTSTSATSDTYYEPTNGFRTGTWRLEFVRASDGVLLQSGTFVVGDVAPEPVTGSFDGTWQTNFATMRLTQSGNRVSGSYTRYSRSASTDLSGTVTNRLFRGTNETGTDFALQLSADGRSFTGHWIGRDGLRYPWCGVRGGSLPDGCGFSGIWQTNHRPNGWVELVQTGDRIRGVYFNGATTGTLSGDFEFYGNGQDYSVAGSFRADAGTDRGSFRFTLSNLDSAEFQGCWRDDGTRKTGSWCGWPGQPGACVELPAC